MKFACPHCGQHLESDQTVSGQSVECPGCKKEIVFAARPVNAPVPAAPTAAADGAPASDKLQSLWGKSIRDQSRPEVTIKEAAVSTMRHTASISARLNVRPQAVAEPGANLEPPPHYQILKLLGKGGMGMVYEARQTSMDRTIALKMIKPEAAQEKQDRNSFLAEAVATGDLDHPNIVPVYDLGANDQGVLFYAMKEVQGTAWSKVIKDKSVGENLDILMRVADAVAFAHSKGVIHRDLKPENVMLGEYGEVLLMDWGLAAAVRPGAKAEQLTPDYAVGGTPAYMSPEMAYGEIETIGPASDVYLLGAILFEILTGQRPHTGKTVLACLQNAADNKLPETDVQGELMDIALKAMATEPQNRFAGVKEFQAQVREYQRHAESIVLSEHAGEELGRAVKSKQYMLYAEAVSGYRQALKLWAKNKAAKKGLAEARLAYAAFAMEKDDLDMAASLLDSTEPSHREMARKVETARKERAARKLRHKLFKTVAVGSAAVVIVILSVAFVWVQSARRGEIVQRKKAEQALTNFKAEQASRQADRKASAPELVQSAKMAVEQQRMKSGMTLVETAIEYDPGLAEARLIHAILLARNADYARALLECDEYRKLNPGDEEGRYLSEICGVAITKGSDAYLGDLPGIVARQGMPLLAAQFSKSGKEKLALYREKLAKAWPKHAAYLTMGADGKLDMKLNIAPAPADLTALSDIPLSSLTVSDNLQISDLSPLKGMPLNTLTLRSCTGINDLSPLRGMPLTQLIMSGPNSVRDLSPLKGMRLKQLQIGGGPVYDLTPLTGMPLEDLDCSANRQRTDLTPLVGLPLHRLNLSTTGVTDLTPLKGMPLKTLLLHSSAVMNIAPLKGLPLEYLDLYSTGITDLTPLKGMPLNTLHIEYGAVNDLTPLEGLKLKELIFSPWRISKGIEVVRSMDSLTTLGVEPLSLRKWTPDEFWKKYDAGAFKSEVIYRASLLPNAGSAVRK